MATLPRETVDGLLKALLVLSRASDQMLETRAVEAAVDQPLSLSRVQILRLLARGRQTSTQLARYLSVSKPAISQIIDSMVRSRLVSRQPAKHDRREVGLRLTDRGKLMVNAVRRRQRHLLRSALRGSTLKETRRWIESLEAITVALAGADRAFEQFCLQCGAHADRKCVLVGGHTDCLFLKHETKAAKGRHRTSSTATAKSSARRKKKPRGS